VDSANIDPASSAAALSKRQLQVLRLVAEGLTYREVGARLQLSSRTIKSHMREIMDRLHLKNRAQVLAHAGPMGWTSEPADSQLTPPNLS